MKILEFGRLYSWVKKARTVKIPSGKIPIYSTLMHFVVLYLFSQPDDASVFLLLVPSPRLTGSLAVSLLCSYGLMGVEAPTDAKP